MQTAWCLVFYSIDDEYFCIEKVVGPYSYDEAFELQYSYSGPLCVQRAPLNNAIDGDNICEQIN